MIKEKIKKIWDKTMLFAKHRLPPGMRLVVGLLLMVFGVFGFMPFFGFWMLPLGFAIAALDVRPMWRRLCGSQHN